MREDRPNLRAPIYGELTQGSIFSCAKAAKYQGCEVLGLTITARCDVAQSKFPVLNYVPVVSLRDWLRKDGLDILIEQEQGEQNGSIKSILKQASVSDALLSYVPLNQIAETHFPEGEGTKAQKTAAKNIREKIELKNDFMAVQASGDEEKVFSWFRRNRETKIAELVRRLSKHAILGHYLLETLSLNGEKPLGFVCLLREVTTLSKPIAQLLGKGIDCETYAELADREPINKNELEISDDGLAMPLVEVGSPTIEHVLQSFANLFGRIGVADPVEETINGIVHQCIVDSKEL